jgi:hypothetical protein
MPFSDKKSLLNRYGFLKMENRNDLAHKALICRDLAPSFLLHFENYKRILQFKI